MDSISFLIDREDGVMNHTKVTQTLYLLSFTCFKNTLHTGIINPN